MAYESFPNNQHNNRAVSLAEHEQIAVPLGLSGLLKYTTVAPVFADATGLRVKLRAGVGASIRGTRFSNTTETTITIPPNTSGNTRVDLVVLRLRRQESGAGVGDQYTVSPVVIPGMPAATNPAAPAPVRDDTPGAGFWDLPLAQVTVTNNATSIIAAQVAARCYFIAGSGYTGRDEWAKPPVEPGVLFRANDTGITYIGTATGEWQALYYDTGWVAINTGQSKAGWSFVNCAIARDGNIVVVDLYLNRTGGALGASTHQYFGPVASHFRPSRNIYAPMYVNSPSHVTYAVMQPNGVLMLVGNYVEGINKGAQVVGSMMWKVGA